MSTTETVEIVSELPSEAVALIKQGGLSNDTAGSLHSAFAPLYKSARDVLERSRGITVTDAAQKLEIKIARECRLALKAIRVESDKKRKGLKDEYLRTGKAIDGFHNILEHLVSGEEKRLQEQEDFAEIQEQKRMAALKAEREELLKPFGVDPAFYNLGAMPADQFTQLLESSRIAHEAKLEAKRKAEADRIAREQAEAAERQRIKEENERLKREAAEREAAAKAERERVAKERAEAEAKLAEERRLAEEARKQAEAKAKAERDAIEAKARAEREELERKAKAEREAAQAKAAEERRERERIEAELRKKQEEEEARIAKEKAAAKRAALAPDSDKVRAYAASIRALSVPQVNNPEAIALVSQIREQQEKFALWLEKKADELASIKAA